MTIGSSADSDRVFPYRAKMHFMGCGVAMFILIGSGAFILIPQGLGKIANGDKSTGYAVLAIGLATALLLLMGILGTGMLVMDVTARHALHLTTSSLVLPELLRGRRDMDEKGEPLGDWQPPEIPFSAIRWARREHGISKGNDQLLIVHTLGPTTLILQQWRMRSADFDELEMILRAAVPAVFVPAPPSF